MMPLLALWLALSGTASAADVRLDLGGEDSHLLDGFERVTPWTSPDGVSVGGPVAGKARVWGGTGWPDALVADGLYPGATLTIDLPAGTYHIAALYADREYGYRPNVGQRTGLQTPDGGWVADYTIPVGDAFFTSRYWGALDRPRFEPGQTQWERQFKAATPWQTDTVEVAGDGLTLSVVGEELAALVIQDRSLAELEVDLALIDDARRRSSHEQRPPDEPPLARATEGLAGLQPLSWDERPETGFRPTALTTRTVDVSPGQRLTGLLAIHGSDTPATLRVQAPAHFDAEAFEVTWLEGIEQWVLRARPTVLIPLEDTDERGVGGTIQAGQGLVPMASWAVSIPPDAEPGRHRVRVTAERDGRMVEHVVRLRVRDLVLEPPAVPYGFWADLHGATAKAYGPDSEQARAMWADGLRRTRQRGATLLAVRGTFFPHDWTPPGGEIYEDRLEWALEEWRSQGGDWALWVDPVFSLQRDFVLQDFEELSPEGVELARRYAEASVANGVPMLTNDERVSAYGPKVIPGLERMLRQIDEVGGGVLQAASAGSPAGAMLYSERTDIVFIQPASGFFPDRVAFFDDKRAAGWSYNLGTSREAAGHLPWMLGTEGLLLWHLSGRYHNAYIEDRFPAWQFTIPRPDLGHTLPLRRLEQAGEGHEDQRVLSTLAVLVDELLDHRRAEVRAEAAIGCGILTAARDAAIAVERGKLGDLSSVSDEGLDALRDAAGDQAEKLARWSRRQRRLRKGRPVPELRGLYPKACADEPTARSR